MVPGLIPSVDVNVCAIKLPAPADPPETLDALCIDQVKVVEGTRFGFVILILVVWPLQMEASEANASGTRSTVNVAAGLLVDEQVPVTTT